MKELEFIGLKDFGFGPVAEFTDEFCSCSDDADRIIRFDKGSLLTRIENLKKYGRNIDEELRGLNAIAEETND